MYFFMNKLLIQTFNGENSRNSELPLNHAVCTSITILGEVDIAANLI